MFQVNPILWVAAGIALAAIGFLFLDRYLPQLGLVWNIQNASVWGIPYRYVLTFAILLILCGGYLWWTEKPKAD
jgi:hypothetical protein